jgi:hypothetical protein
MLTFWRNILTSVWDRSDQGEDVARSCRQVTKECDYLQVREEMRDKEELCLSQ